MTETLAQLSKGALSDLAGVFAAMPENALDGLIEAIVAAKRIVVFGLGREGLQMRGFAMRLFHMGRDVAVWGDMTTPALGAGDLFIASAGPGDLPTAQTLVEIARKGWRPHGACHRPTRRRTRQTRRRRYGHSRPDDGERSGRQAVRSADGLSLRDRADDRLRTRDPQTAPAFQRNLGDDARAAHQPRVIASHCRNGKARINCDHNLSQMQPQFLFKPSAAITTRIGAHGDSRSRLSDKAFIEIRLRDPAGDYGERDWRSTGQSLWSSAASRLRSSFRRPPRPPKTRSRNRCATSMSSSPPL